MRVGMGYDIHRIKKGRALYLGGVLIPDTSLGLDGHSDADVILHALCDALLGAAGLGDIGTRFPNSDPSHLNQRSTFFLTMVAKAINESGYAIENIDCTLIAERPKIVAHTQTMKEVIANILHLPTAAIGIKATTNEKVGFIGRGEGMAALAVALLRPIL